MLNQYYGILFAFVMRNRIQPKEKQYCPTSYLPCCIYRCPTTYLLHPVNSLLIGLYLVRGSFNITG